MEIRDRDGEQPQDWKPMSTVGTGVREIRIRESDGAFRVIYLATRPEGILATRRFKMISGGNT